MGEGIIVLWEINHKKTKHAESYFKAGICNLKLHRYEEAFKYISKALELEPSNIQWKEQLEQCARHLDKLNNHMVSKSSTEEDLLRENLIQTLIIQNYTIDLLRFFIKRALVAGSWYAEKRNKIRSFNTWTLFQTWHRIRKDGAF